jgi:ElaB/YqjD/DUF883 family membrane-anchored ribosome-binding protein
MEDQQDVLNEMEHTRSSLSDKLEALEHEVAEKVKPVTTAVERVAEAAANIAESVQDTVEGVKEKVEATAEAVTSAFDLRKQTESHPWVVFGLAATTGCMLGSFLSRRSRGGRRASSSAPARHARETNGKSHHAKPAKPAAQESAAAKPGWLGESLQHLKGMAVGALMSAVRDLVKQGLPGNLGEKIAEEVECMTRKMGAEPIQGPVLPEKSESKQEGEDPEFKTMPDPVNRILSTG